MPQTATHHQCAHFQASTTIRFCPNVAAAIGVNEAIVIHRLDYWLGRTKHHFDGCAWVYNTYESWQDQLPFWSRRTIQATFRRLERLGIVESSQAHNRSRWDKTKWYTIDYNRLSELVPQTPVKEAPVVDMPMTAPSMVLEATTDETQPDTIDNAPTDTIDDAEASPSWLTKDSPTKPSNKILNRAGVREPDAGARIPALEVTKPVVSPCHHETKPVNELDVAYTAIPEAERQTWYERADQALAAAGMPEWMRITPTVKATAVRIWLGEVTSGGMLTLVPAMAPDD
jgi:hypothetical protein